MFHPLQPPAFSAVKHRRCTPADPAPPLFRVTDSADSLWRRPPPRVRVRPGSCHRRDRRPCADGGTRAFSPCRFERQAPLLVDQMTVDNRRLLWELQTINEIADGISQSLELDEVLTGRAAAHRQGLRRGRRVDSAARRAYRPLRSRRPRRPAAPAGVLGCFGCLARAIRSSRRAPRSSSKTSRCRSRRPCARDLALRSGISLPLVAGSDAARRSHVSASSSPRRFDLADERLLAMIAGQIVVAVQNARLHDLVRRGKQEWERTFDAISDPIAVFDERGKLLRGNTALAALLERPVTELPGMPCTRGRALRRRLPVVRGRPGAAQEGAERAEITLASQQIFSVTTFPADGLTEGASVVQVAKNVTEETRSARRLQALSDELAKANAPADRDARAAEVDAGAAAPGGEAVGDRSARRRRRARAQQPADERHRLRAAARERVAVGRRARAPERRRRPAISAASPRSPDARPASSATCWRSRGVRRRRASRRTSPISSDACSRCGPTSSA